MTEDKKAGVRLKGGGKVFDKKAATLARENKIHLDTALLFQGMQRSENGVVC